MDEQTSIKKQSKSVFKLIAIIIGMLAFGGLGFYFGIQDTFHVSNKINKEKKEDPKIEIKTEEETYTLDSTKLYKDEYKDDDNLASIFYFLFNDYSKDLSNLSDEDKYQIAFGLTILDGKETITDLTLTEEELFDLGYASNKEYVVNVLDVQSNLSKYFGTYNAQYIPDTIYDELVSFKLVDNKYIGHLIIGGIEFNGCYYFVSNVETTSNNKEITVSKVYSNGEIYSADIDETITYKTEEEVLNHLNELETYKITFDYNKTEGQLVTITK